MTVLSACGVRATEIVPGAQGATIAAQQVLLYLLTSDQQLVRRTRVHDGRITDTTALSELLKGLTAAEKEAGLSTEVPTSSSPITIDEKGMVVLPEDVGQLSKTALFQVACTAQVNGVVVASAAARFNCP